MGTIVSRPNVNLAGSAGQLMLDFSKIMHRLLPRVQALVLAVVLTAVAVPIEPQHPVYEFIRRLDLKGAVPPGFEGILPWDSRDILSRLEAAEAVKERLQEWERRSLDVYLQEFSPERRSASTRLKAADSAYSVFAGATFWGAGYIQDSLPQGQRFLTGSFNPYLEAGFWGVGYAASSISIGMERSHVERFTETYRAVDGLPYNTNREGKAGIPQSVSTFDGFRVVTGFRKGPIRLDAGQDWNRFGPTHWQRATLGTGGYFWVQDSLPASDTVGFPGTEFPGRHRRGYRRPGESAPMPQLRLAFQGGRFAYVKLVAQRDGILGNQLATLVAHRLEWRVLPWLTLGGTELASIGGRVPEPVHWLPLVPLKIMEHQVKDKDNLAMSFDAEVRRSGLGRVYGELYLDDFSGPPFDFWGNKFAYAVGMEWIDPMRIAGVLRAEFAHVDPWVFTHHLPGRQHQHAGALYGSGLPGNSHALWVQAVCPLPRNLEASFQWTFQQRDVRTRGSSLFDVFQQGVDDRVKDFLGNTPETRNQVLFDLTWSWRRYLRFKAGLGYLVVEDWKGVAGESLASPSLLGELVLQY